MDVDGQGIAPLKRDGDKNHKILKFPILRASVKAYKNNLNTHKSYSKFREKRKSLRSKNKDYWFGINRHSQKLCTNRICGVY